MAAVCPLPAEEARAIHGFLRGVGGGVALPPAGFGAGDGFGAGPVGRSSA